MIPSNLRQKTITLFNSNFLGLTMFESTNHDKVIFFSARTSPNSSHFPCQVKHVRFLSISRQRQTRKLFSIIILTQRIIRTRSSIFYYMVDINIHTRNLPVYNSGQYIYVTSLCKFFFVFQDLIDRINSHFQRIAFQRNLLLIGF